MIDLESQETERRQDDAQVSELVSDGLWRQLPQLRIQIANSKKRLALVWHKLTCRIKGFPFLAHPFHPLSRSEFSLSLSVSLVTEEVLPKEKKKLISSQNANVRTTISFTHFQRGVKKNNIVVR